MVGGTLNSNGSRVGVVEPDEVLVLVLVLDVLDVVAVLDKLPPGRMLTTVT